jgi:hypothetical protein
MFPNRSHPALFLLLILLSQGARADRTCTVPGNAPELSFEGRVVASVEGVTRQGYPGIALRVRFRGSALSCMFRTTSDELYLDVSVDGGAPVFVKVPKGTGELVLAKNLTEGEHRIALWKRVESAVGILDLLSVRVAGELLPPDPLPVRKLLFLGDSFTAGQATTVEEGGPMDPSKAMRQNARLSYGHLLAGRLNAQVHLIAYAGRGIVRDWQGLSAVRCAPEYYEYALPDDDSSRWDPRSYVPDAIGVCLGNNDFDVGIPDQVDYLRAYCEFIRKLRHDAPSAHIFLITSPSLTDEPGRVPKRSVQLAYLEEAARRLADSRVHVVQLPHFNGVPGDWHPSGTAHRTVAAQLEPLLRQALNWNP